MTFALPAVKDACNIGRGTGDPKFLANINSPTNTGTKANGSLPLADVATEFDGNTAGQVKGYAKEFENGQSPAYDVSSNTKVMLWHSQCNAPNRIQVNNVANGGLRIRIYSGTGSPPSTYKEYYVGGNDTPFAASISGQYPLVIDLNDTSHDASSGTFSNTSVTSFAVLTNRTNMAGSNTNWNYQGKMYLLDTTKTSSSTPTFSGSGASIVDAVTQIQGSNYTNKFGSWVRQIGDVVFLDIPFRIGNNSSITTFTDDGKTIISPKANDPADPRVRVTTQALRTYLNLRNNAADTATFSGTWIWNVRSPFDWDQDDSAVVTFNSPTFRGMGEITLGSSITGDATFDDVDAVILADTGVDLDGSTFRNQNGNHALEMTAGAMDIADMRFESYASKHAILIDTAGTYNFSNVFFDQSGTNDIETTHSSGEVVINITNGGTTPTVTKTGAGTYKVNSLKTIKCIAQTVDGTKVQNVRVHMRVNASGGLPYQASVTISNSGTTATVTHTAHGLSTNDKVFIEGASHTENNGVHQITVTAANTYTYTMASAPGSSPTGTITSTFVLVNGLTDVNGEVSASVNIGADQAYTGSARKASSSPYYKPFPLVGTASGSAATTTTAVMIAD